MAVDSVNADSSLLSDATINGLVETAESDDEFANMEKGKLGRHSNSCKVCLFAHKVSIPL